MPDTGAPWNIPYVAGTDLVADWPTDSQTLAEAIADGLDDAGGLTQFKYATDSTARSTTSTSYSTANISLSFTPTAADSLLLIEWTCSGLTRFNGGTNQLRRVGFYRITDTTSAVLGAEGAPTHRQLVSATNNQAHDYEYINLRALVVAGDTSARTYQGEFKTENSANITIIQNDLQTGILSVTELKAGVL